MQDVYREIRIYRSGAITDCNGLALRETELLALGRLVQSCASLERSLRELADSFDLGRTKT